MSSIKVSALTAKTTPAGTEELLINDSGVSKKITIANLTKGHDLPAVPSGITTDTNKEYNLKLTDVSGTETLTWIEKTDNDTTYSNFVGDDGADGVTTAAGLVPAPAEGDAAAGKYLDSDGNWTVPPDTDTTYSNFAGTAAGLVPTSTTGDDTKFLRADGTWVVPTDTDTVYSLPEATATAKGGIELFSDTAQTVAATAVSATADRTYGVQLNSAGQGVVNVPWVDTDTDTDTTYTAGNGLALATGEFTLDLTKDQSWTGSQRGTVVTDNDGSFDMNGGNNFKCTPTGAITLTFTNITDGQSGFILLVNSGQTVSAAATTKVDANLLATVTAAGTYLVSYFSDGTNVYLTNSAVYA